MHILFLTADLPFPPDSGPQAKTYNLLQHLTQVHRVTLVSFTAGTNLAGVTRLRELGAEVHTIHTHSSVGPSVQTRSFNWSPNPLPLATRAAVQQMHNLLAMLSEQAATRGEPFELVHADQIVMAPFATPLQLPRLLDLHHLPWADVEGQIATATGLARWLLQREIKALRHETGRIAAAFDALTVVSEDDRRTLAELLKPGSTISVIPIAVDPPVQEYALPRATNAQNILSLTALGRSTNADGVRWFARDVYPLVRRQSPQSRLDICGAAPPAAIRDLAERDPTILVHGHIDDPRPFIHTAGCLIVPLRNGGGMRVTILEALARGIPVVATSIGCAELDLQPGEHLLVADTPSEFADAVSLLLRDPELGLRLAEAGRRQVIERYAWNVVCPAIDVVYTRITPSMSQRTQRTLAPLSDRL